MGNLVIARTYLSGKARDIFINKMDLDENTWIRSRAWAPWKARLKIVQKMCCRKELLARYVYNASY